MHRGNSRTGLDRPWWLQNWHIARQSANSVKCVSPIYRPALPYKKYSW